MEIDARGIKLFYFSSICILVALVYLGVESSGVFWYNYMN